LLKGYFYSGCTDKVNSDYGAWQDTHMPPRSHSNSRFLESASLLNQTEISKTLKEIPKEAFVGVKLLNPYRVKTIESSVGMNAETIQMIKTINFGRNYESR